MDALKKKPADRGGSGFALAGSEPLKKEKEKERERGGADDIFAVR